MDSQQLRNILESCLLVAGKPMSIAQLEVVFDEDIDRPERAEIKEALLLLQQSYEGRGIELVEIASGWRLQSASSMEHWVGRLFQEKQPRYSRALLETLVLIAYRQPITRGEIEEVRGVAVSSNIIRTLQERDWVKEMGYKDVPGKPALWGTTKEFLDYFNLKRLDELPTLAEARDLAEIDAALAAEVGLVDGVTDSVAANDSQGEGENDKTGGDGPEPGVMSEAEAETDTGTEAEAEGAVTEKDAEVKGEAATEAGVEAEVGTISDEDEESASVPDTDTKAEVAVGEDADADAGTVTESTDAAVSEQTDSDALSEESNSIGETADSLESNANTNNVDKELEPVANTGSGGESESASTTLLAADASVGVDGLNTEHPADAKPTPLQLADVDVPGAEDNDDGSDLISLAATLGKEGLPPDQPDLGSVVESFEGESNPDDSDPVESTELDSLTDTPLPSGEGDERHVESVEISAHDLDIGEWKAPESTRQRLNEGEAEPVRAEAEADLRRVIDDFAEEHRQQLDADNQLKSASGSAIESDASSASSFRKLDGTGNTENEPVTTEDDEDGAQRTRLYGIRGAVDSELNSDVQNDDSNQPPDDQYDEAKSGEP